MNRSLVGVVREVLDHSGFGEVYGAVHGLGGILEEEFLDLGRLPRKVWSVVAKTPGAVLGSGRLSLRNEDVPAILRVLGKHNIGYLFTVGGNDTAETAHRIVEATRTQGQEVTVIHVPKTIDNDLMETDHTPGYGSAARFVALATMGAGRDTEAMGKASPITIMEVMGRDAGWLAASAALGKRDEMDAPHYICVPEVSLNEAHFIATMEEAYSRWGFAVAVTAENVKSLSGSPGSSNTPYYVDDFGHEYFEGPAKYLAQLLSHNLKVRVRDEKPGTIQRSLMTCISKTDAAEAELAGRAAVNYALKGHTDAMVTLVRQPGQKYQCDTGLAPLENVMGKVKSMPDSYIDADNGLMTQEFLDYARPLIGAPVPRYARLVNSRLRF